MTTGFYHLCYGLRPNYAHKLFRSYARWQVQIVNSESELSSLSRFRFVTLHSIFLPSKNLYSVLPSVLNPGSSLSLREMPVNPISIPWGAAPRFLWDTGSDVFRPKSVPSSPMVKRAFSRLGTITAGWGRSIRKHGSTLQSEDRKRWASSQDCSSTCLNSYKGKRIDLISDTLYFHSSILA